MLRFMGSHQSDTTERLNCTELRDFFKKTRHTKGTFHAKMGSIKDKNGMDLN